MKGLFEHGETINLQPYYSDARALNAACQVAQSGNLNGRTLQQKVNDCINGYALEYAVFDALASKGLTVAPAPIKEYDLVVELNNDTLHIDVKGIFKPTSSTYTQSEWETYSVANLKYDVFYLCFDCRSGTAVYDGWTTQKGFTPSNFYKGGAYIFANELDK